MKDQTTITARIPNDLSGDLATLAGALQRPRAGVVAEALRGYIAREKAFLEAIEEGIRAEEAGDMVDHAEVVAELDAIIADARKQRA